jgi:hypothetical protein
MFSDFIQVLNSARGVYTNNHYFSNSKLFTIISLLQRQRLNPRSYSMQTLNMELFYKLLTMVCTCMQKFRALQSVDICKQIFLYLSSYNFVQNLLYKSEFGQAHCEKWFKRSPTKFIL